MLPVLQRLLLFILLSAVVQGAAPPAAAADPLTTNSMFRQVHVEHSALRIGQTQQLYVTLDSPPDELVVLTLSITYPSGLKRTVVESTLGKEATLSWDIPSEAGVGAATYQLATGGCGCGYSRDGRPKAEFSSIAKGSFMIE